MADSNARYEVKRRDYSAPPETAVLTVAQLAQWLQVSERQVERIDWIPWVEVGGSRSRRCLVRDVLAALEGRRKVASRDGAAHVVARHEPEGVR